MQLRTTACKPQVLFIETVSLVLFKTIIIQPAWIGLVWLSKSEHTVIVSSFKRLHQQHLPDAWSQDPRAPNRSKSSSLHTRFLSDVWSDHWGYPIHAASTSHLSLHLIPHAWSENSSLKRTIILRGFQRCLRLMDISSEFRSLEALMLSSLSNTHFCGTSDADLWRSEIELVNTFAPAYRFNRPIT